MDVKTLKIAIVGHTNTGKTSLIRTITRERNFGEVKDEASTTIDVAEIKRASDQLTLAYIDTPGIEDAMGVLDLLETKFPAKSRLEEADNLLKFANDTEIEHEYEQEVKVIKQLFATDLTCYVIDCRLPFLPKFDDELTLISKTHRPILPILNFIHGEHLKTWKKHLKAHGIHHYLEFDTIIPPQKRRFYEQIAIMFPEYYAEIMAYIQLEEIAENERLADALKIAANFYLNLMTLQIKEKQQISSKAIKLLNQSIAKIEQRAIQSLLHLYQFNQEDIAYFTLMVQGSQYEKDFFTRDNLIDFTVQFSKGASIGAGAMVGIDALAGFTTFGAMTATGAVVGGFAASLKNYGISLLDKLQNIETFCVNNDAINYLTIRLLYIIGALSGRSHAELTPIYLHQDIEDNHVSLMPLIQETKSLRAHPEYCEKETPIISTKRDKILSEITTKIIYFYQEAIPNQTNTQ